MGGGNHSGRTCVNLMLDGKAVRSATGQARELLQWVCWDVKAFKDKMVRVRIVDNETGGWGHINVDQIHQSDIGLWRSRGALRHGGVDLDGGAILLEGEVRERARDLEGGVRRLDAALPFGGSTPSDQ